MNEQNNAKAMQEDARNIVGRISLDGFSYPVNEGDELLNDEIFSALIEQSGSSEKSS